MAHIPVPGKGPVLVLLLTALPSFLHAHPRHPIISSVKGFILFAQSMSVTPFASLHHQPASDWASQECMTQMRWGVGAGREVTHWVLTHQLYKVTRGPRKEGQVSSQ